MLEKELEQLSFLIENAEDIGLDWSGVVSNDLKPVYEANIRVLKYYKEELGYDVKIPTYEEWREIGASNCILLFNKMRLYGDKEELYNQYGRKLNEANKEGIVPIIYPGVKETIEYLYNNGKKLFVLSSHPQDNLIKEAEEYEIINYFSEIFGNYNDKIEGLGFIYDKLNLNKEKTLYVGDTVPDAEAASAVGLFNSKGINFFAVSCGYNSKKRHEEEMKKIGLAYLVVDDLASIMEIERTKLK